MKKANLLINIKAVLGEAPVWNETNKSLYFVDILGKKLFRYKQEGQSLNEYPMPEMISCFSFGDDGLIYAMLETGLYSFNEETSELKFISKPDDLDKSHRFNDGKCDPNGRFYVGSMENIFTNPTGSLYFVDDTMSFTKVEDKAFIVPNGMCWDSAKNKFYHVDTTKGNVNVYDYDSETGKIINKQRIIHFAKEQGSPDGMVMDHEGMLWIAHWDAYKIGRWNPQNGILIDEVEVPCERPTSMVFGGEDGRELFITTASLEDAKGENPGAVYSFKCPVGGNLLYPFRTKKTK